MFMPPMDEQFITRSFATSIIAHSLSAWSTCTERVRPESRRTPETTSTVRSRRQNRLRADEVTPITGNEALFRTGFQAAKMQMNHIGDDKRTREICQLNSPAPQVTRIAALTDVLHQGICHSRADGRA